MFTLEVLQAGEGDCLLLHYGDDESPRLILVDGGPPSIYRDVLRPRLEQLRSERAGEGPLTLDLVMVSHIDADHITGILDLVTELQEEREADREPSYDPSTLWHNSFDDIVEHDELGSGPASIAAAVGEGPAGLALTEPASLVVASIGQGRDLRDAARDLALSVNNPFDGLVVAPREIDWGDGLTLTVVGPSSRRLERLRTRWEREPVKSAAIAAEYLDRSVYNLSSIVVLAEQGNRRMLLTGDARGDDILAGLEEGALLENGRTHVDLLKLPHHGSDRNVETEFFRIVTADHYVISANGKHDNPEIATLEMISAARSDNDFTLHLTNHDGENDLGQRLDDFLARERAAGHDYTVRFRPEDDLSFAVALGAT